MLNKNIKQKMETTEIRKKYLKLKKNRLDRIKNRMELTEEREKGL